MADVSKLRLFAVGITGLACLPVSNWPGHLQPVGPIKHLHVLNTHLLRARDIGAGIYVYSAVLAFFSRYKMPQLIQQRPRICSTGPNPMQPTAVDEAVIGEMLRLSNTRESWLGHSLLGCAQRVADDIIEQQSWGRIRRWAYNN